MSFALSAEETRLDDGHMLRARLQKADGEWVDAELDLNTVIGNDDGMWTDRSAPSKPYAYNRLKGSFRWNGVNFSESADDITFSIEGGDAVPVLRATLTNMEGNGVDANINLGERIQNIDGAFVFGEQKPSAVERGLLY
jgi:hypothetical protein